MSLTQSVKPCETVPIVLWLEIANWLSDRTGFNVVSSRKAWYQPNLLKNFELRIQLSSALIAQLPYKLCNIKLVDCSSVTSFGSFAPYVTRIFVECDEPIDEIIWPPSLTELEFSPIFKQNVEDCCELPSSLTSLKFGGVYNRFNRPVEKLRLPDSISILEFGHWFNQSVEKLQLPPALTKIGRAHV